VLNCDPGNRNRANAIRPNIRDLSYNVKPIPASAPSGPRQRAIPSPLGTAYRETSKIL